ncbi:hypothetical protein YC2023_112435 [Brassica napus]
MTWGLGQSVGIVEPREKQVILWRFGMEDGRMKTLREIGETMGEKEEGTAEKVSMREKKAKKDPNKPKRALSALFIFLEDFRTT